MKIDDDRIPAQVADEIEIDSWRERLQAFVFGFLCGGIVVGVIKTYFS